ncbi:MAG: glycosyltransferase family 2 protein [Planctomycetota bacterium]
MTDARGGNAAPRLGVGICALNEARALPRLLSRLLQVRDATDRADAVAVADGGSSDGTAELARRMGARVVEPGRGRGVQLGAAAEALLEDGAERLLFLHADCVPRTGSIAALRAALERPGVRAAALRQTVEAEGRTFRWIERAANGRARRGMVYGDSGMALHADVYRAAGGFPAVPLFEDVALSKAVRRIAPIHLVEDATLAISPRRWRREGVLRCTVRNWILRGLYECGVPPERLARRFYRSHAD